MTSAPITTAQTPASSGGMAFTGRVRRTTRRSVKVIDRIARYVICGGGLGVVLAFIGIAVFITTEVIPLFRDARLEARPTIVLAKRPATDGPSATATAPATQPSATQTASTQPTAPESKPLAMGMDENLATLWVLDGGGDLSTYRAGGGQVVKVESITKQPITAASNNRGDVALGFADGTVRVGQVGSQLEFLDPKALPDNIESIQPGQTVPFKNGVAMMSSADQVRIVRTVADLSEPLSVGESPASPVIAVDYNFSQTLEVLAAMRADGRLFLGTVTKKENVMTGKVRRTARNFELPVPPAYKAQRPAALLLGLNGRLVFLVYPEGRLIRYNTDTPDEAFVAEEMSLLPAGAGSKITAVRMLLGSLTLIVADSTGGVSGWFPAPVSPGTGPRDNMRVVQAHKHEKQSSPVTSIGTSARDRQFVTANASGDVVVRHMTSTTVQGQVHVDVAAPVALVEMSPKTDAVAVLDEARDLTLIRMDNPHPDGKMSQLFRPVWYEGYAEPTYTYQSSAGTDDAELKLSLIPLIFGTFKATFYAMLFAVPIAILAAIYSSEFMQPQVRTVVKPLVEMMASLPSVVLGFLAALVLAPIVENAIMAVLTAFVAIPLGLVLFGFIWQLLPGDLTRRVPGVVRFVILLLLVSIMFGVAMLVGPLLEKLAFHGDFKAWLDGRVGSATPGWAILLSPACLFFVVLGYKRWIEPRRQLARSRTLLATGTIELSRAVLMLAVAVGLATVCGMSFSAMGIDIRGTLVGSYVQRNSLILGVVMGFAIIPIIYTVSEDALSSVPHTLRSASLGAGATPWQTAMRVVLPVAASGVFAACMIGFGRAAGETMIVLMASGRTTIIDVNIFNGLSALSANIATELPEAPNNSTHYRVLFLSAVVLFVITFIVNTTAEVIRLRFRKRAYQL